MLSHRRIGNMPGKRHVALLAGLVCLCWANLAGAATYYVSPDGDDENPGTQGQPFATVKHAATIVNPGDTVLVADGLYDHEWLSGTGGTGCSFRRSGTPAAPITFRAMNPGQAAFDFTGLDNAKVGWSVQAEWMVLDGFRLFGAPWYTLEIAGSKARHVRIINCIFHHVNDPDNPDQPTSRAQDIVKVLGGAEYIEFAHNTWDARFGRWRRNSFDCFGSYIHFHHNVMIKDGPHGGSYLLIKGGANNNRVYNNYFTNLDPRSRSGERFAVFVGGGDRERLQAG